MIAAIAAMAMAFQLAKNLRQRPGGQPRAKRRTFRPTPFGRFWLRTPIQLNLVDSDLQLALEFVEEVPVGTGGNNLLRG